MHETHPTPAEMVIEAIREIQQQKRSARKHPNHVLILQDRLYDCVRTTLSREGFRRVLSNLASAGKIRIARTINDDCVSIADPQTKTER